MVTAIMPFKVTDFGTNRKLVCDFLLVINTNLLLSCTVSEMWLSTYLATALSITPNGGVPLGRSRRWPKYQVAY